LLNGLGIEKGEARLMVKGSFSFVAVWVEVFSLKGQGKFANCWSREIPLVKKAS